MGRGAVLTLCELWSGERTGQFLKWPAQNHVTVIAEKPRDELDGISKILEL